MASKDKKASYASTCQAGAIRTISDLNCLYVDTKNDEDGP